MRAIAPATYALATRSVAAPKQELNKFTRKLRRFIRKSVSKVLISFTPSNTVLLVDRYRSQRKDFTRISKDRHKMTETVHTKSWPDLAAGLYDHLTGRGAEISYEFKDMSVKIPSGTGDKAEHAQWVLSGTITIRTKDNSSRPK